MDINKNIFIINENGTSFYLKWRKDSIQSFVIAPVFFIFFAALFTGIVGISFKLLFILIWPLILSIILFVYLPLFVRKKYINNLINLVSIEGDQILIETFKWFRYGSIKKTILNIDVELKPSIGYSFFKNKKIHTLTIKNSGLETYYIVDEFFDGIDKLLDAIKNN